jgi:pantoate--beta-alanine ligase
MQTAKTIAEIRACVREARAVGKTVGFVPTMGALHAGHISLIKAARTRCDHAVVSIFVNPTQFGPGEDLDKYPRPFEQDLAICESHGVDAVFAPTAAEMYPRENLTWVNVEKLTDRLCGQFRPGHFRGVATVCTKLFNIVGPDVAFFGQKDAQQALVVRRMVADLNMPLEIVVCPTVREPDGLAMSSRNRYLAPQERKDAARIYKSLESSRELIESGQRDAGAIRARMCEVLEGVPSMRVEYASIADAETLEELDRIRGRVLIAVAVRMESARLIDNILVDAPAE